MSVAPDDASAGSTPSAAPAFASTIDSVDELRTYYREPNEFVRNKETSVLDDGCARFIATSTFVLVATSDRDGRLDVSPRGGPAGFVKVIDERRLVIPDLNGNNRLDSLCNVIEHDQIGLLFLIPGSGETLRVNGRAWVTVDDEILDLFVGELRRPISAIGVEVEQAFVHCAKSVRRGGLWTPDAWPDPAARPSPGQMLVDHAGVADQITGAQLDGLLEQGYASDLAADAPD
ncbi:MAG: MSMEG_1061 family FMN-dependent PPOX-type flavoprotein [Ilumatobacter sp.]|uniref:MSMEG_1061 family FMN-dependent PPOX-type flavoprotein n=1 Tax=Ilumatobacter sp. TaxID=1967498 RepID=UPI00391A4FCA